MSYTGSHASKVDIELIHDSGVFDTRWYLDQYPDVRALGIDPLEHYLWIGARLGRNPCSNFDTKEYLASYPELAQSGINPLFHFVKQRKRGERIVSGKRVVAFESHNLKLQGAPNSLFEIASGIKKIGKYEPILMANARGPLADEYDKRGIRTAFHGISPDRLNSADSRQKYIDLLTECYLKNEISVLHVNTLQGFHAVLAAHTAGIPVLWNIRESEDPDTYFDYLSPDLRALAYSSIYRASEIAFVSETTRSLWQHRLANRVKNYAIGNGIDIGRLKQFVYGTPREVARHRLGLAVNDVMVLHVATVTERKGQNDIAELIEKLDPKRHRNTVFAIVGLNDADYSIRVAERLEAARAAGVRIMCFRESHAIKERAAVANLYQCADVFLLTSRIESYPRVILEAMEFRLAIVSTPCFGVTEQLVDGVSGLFYNAGDIESLFRILHQVIEDPIKRNAMANHAYGRLVELNSYDKMLSLYQGAYDRLV